MTATDEEKERVRAYYRQKMRDRRARLKAEKGPQEPKILTGPRTTQQQVEDTISQIMSGLNIDRNDTSELYDVQAVSSYIEMGYQSKKDGPYKPYSKASLKTKYSALISYIRDRPEEDPDSSEEEDRQHALKLYRGKMYELAREISKESKKNKKSGRDINNWADWAEIKGIGADNIENSIYKLTYLLYTEIPPRRSEYKSLQILLYPGKKRLDDKDKYPGNYLVLSKSGQTIKYILLRDFKTSGQKGDYIIHLSAKSRTNKLKEAFESVVWDDHGVNIDEEYVFPEHLREEGQWTHHLNRLFKKYLNKEISVNILRKSYVSSHLPRTYEEKEKLAWAMGTSVYELETSYMKIDDDHDSDDPLCC